MIRKLAGERAARSRMRVEQWVADDGLVGDHEHVRLSALGSDVDDDVLHGQALSSVADAVDHLAP